LEEEQAIAVRELDSTTHLGLKHHQLTPKRGILSLESADWPEGESNSLKRKKSSPTIVADGTRFLHQIKRTRFSAYTSDGTGCPPRSPAFVEI
jgi:hypothetical protein